MNSFNKIAKFTGSGYLIIFLTGFFSNFFVLENLVVFQDSAVTTKNIIENEMLFRLGIFGFVIMVLIDLLLVWTLYLLLEPVNKKISLLSGLFRLVNATIFGVALVDLLAVSNLVNKSKSALSIDQINTEVLLSFESFNITWLIGLIFFGIHLLLLGYLIYRSNYIHKIFGLLLFIAGTAYLVDSFSNILLLNYSDYKDILSMVVITPAVIGEFALTVRLIFFNVKIPIQR